MARHRFRYRGVAAACAALVCVFFTGASYADETCNSPYMSKLITGQEDYIYVWALGVDGIGDGSDKLVTVDVHPKSKRYGKVISSVSIGSRNEAHHMGFTDDRRFLWAGGLSDSKIYVFDIGTDPAKPKLARTIADLGERIRPHVNEQLEIAHPLEPALSHLSFVVFVAPPLSGGDARHATIVSPGRLDRSPTGTATSARMAVLDARGTLGETYVAESVLDTRFSGRVVGRTTVGELPAIVPAISGRAWITGFHQLVVDPSDPLAGGFTLPDTWGSGRRTSLPVRRHSGKPIDSPDHHTGAWWTSH